MKRIRTLLAVVISISLTLTCLPTSVVAKNDTTPADFGDPIEETSYYDEALDAFVTDRVYFLPDPVSAYIDNNGTGWYKKERSLTWTGSGRTTTTYAQGYFVWGNGGVSVSLPKGGYDYFPEALKITNQKTDSGKYDSLFNKYAYVTFTLHYVNFLGNNANLDVTIRVDENGKQS